MFCSLISFRPQLSSLKNSQLTPKRKFWSRSMIRTHAFRFNTCSRRCWRDSVSLDKIITLNEKIKHEAKRDWSCFWFFSQVSQFLSGDRKSGSVVPVAGKRKQEVESHSDGRLRKRQHTSQDESEIRNGSDGRVNSRYGAISRNRLRRKQPRVQNTALDEGHATHDDDVPWTEKYRPRSADEVVGNSAAVKKLYRWGAIIRSTKLSPYCYQKHRTFYKNSTPSIWKNMRDTIATVSEKYHFYDNIIGTDLKLISAHAQCQVYASSFYLLFIFKWE